MGELKNLVQSSSTALEQKTQEGAVLRRQLQDLLAKYESVLQENKSLELKVGGMYLDSLRCHRALDAKTLMD